MATDEDVLIANAFIDVREGIVTGNWQKVCDAYESVSGKKLEPPNQPKKTRLEQIRELMGDPEEESDVSSEDDDIEDEKVTIQKTKKKPREKKDLIELEVISDPYDAKTAKKNQELLKKKPRVERDKQKREMAPKDTSGDDTIEDGPRYYSNPPLKPSWR
jgi:hypothetical protein